MVIELLLLTLGGIVKIISQWVMTYRVGKITSFVINRLGTSNIPYLEEVIKRLSLKDNGVLVSAGTGWIGSVVFLVSGSFLLSGLMVSVLKPILFIVWIFLQ